MKEKEYVCGYNHCLHDGEKVKESQAVIVGKRRYHWDCASLKQEIADSLSEYMECVEDKSVYPAAARIINNLVFKNQVPASYILEKIKHTKRYYKGKPVHALYGLRKLFWEKEMR